MGVPFPKLKRGYSRCGFNNDGTMTSCSLGKFRSPTTKLYFQDNGNYKEIPNRFEGLRNSTANWVDMIWTGD
jgi:hypothetical protein